MNLIEALNLEKLQLTEKGFHVQMNLSEFHQQPFGFVNGGAIIAFAEVVAGQASNQLGNGEYYAVGQNVTANHLNSKKCEGYLCAEAELLHKGKRSHVWSIRVVDEKGVLISQITVLNSLIYKTNDPN